MIALLLCAKSVWRWNRHPGGEQISFKITTGRCRASRKWQKSKPVRKMHGTGKEKIGIQTRATTVAVVAVRRRSKKARKEHGKRVKLFVISLTPVNSCCISQLRMRKHRTPTTWARNDSQSDIRASDSLKCHSKGVIFYASSLYLVQRCA